MNNCPGFIKITFLQQSFVTKLVRVKNLMQYERKNYDIVRIALIFISCHSWIPDGTRIIVIIERYVVGWLVFIVYCVFRVWWVDIKPCWSTLGADSLSPDVELLFMQRSNVVSLCTGIIHYKSGRINQKHDTFHFTSIAQVSLTF